MLYYIYDGSFDGLLTAIYEAYYRRENPDKIIFQDDYQENFLVTKRIINTDEEKARRVYNSITEKISNYALRNTFYVFLSEIEDAGTYIYNYLKLGWKLGRDVDSYLSDNRVLQIQKIAQRVAGERHRMLGLIRFRKLQGDVYYAPFKPQYNTVGLVAEHFAKRLSQERWIIHDVVREIAVVYKSNEWIIRDMDFKDAPILSKDETIYQELWKGYFNSIAIKNRINPKLQRRCMPKKYWDFLVEKE